MLQRYLHPSFMQLPSDLFYPSFTTLAFLLFTDEYIVSSPTPNPPPTSACSSLIAACLCNCEMLLQTKATHHSRRPCNSKASGSLWSGCVCVRSKPCRLMLLCCGTAVGNACRKFSGCCFTSTEAIRLMWVLRAGSPG